jgi:hypothetical protein
MPSFTSWLKIPLFYILTLFLFKYLEIQKSRKKSFNFTGVLYPNRRGGLTRPYSFFKGLQNISLLPLDIIIRRENRWMITAA